jgi:potassium channel subfamily K
MIDWDWIGEDSPMMNETTETQFVLERLIESLVRYLKRNRPAREFAETLKESGEDALRLKGGSTADDGYEDSTVLPASDGMSVMSGDTRSIRSWTGSTMSAGVAQFAASVVGSVQPLHELEEEHIHAGPHRTTRYRDIAMDRGKHITY